METLSCTQQQLESIVNLKLFLTVAPTLFSETDYIRQLSLPTGELVSCVRWDGVFYITGTDIIRCLVMRLSAFGRIVTNKKKFKEGVFSDLRNLKCNIDARLEGPKSAFLKFLYKHHCVRTKKKQKVFFWFSVPHEQLFVDALERDMKKDMMMLYGTSGPNDTPATKALREPALSFVYDNTRSLGEQVSAVKKEITSPLAAVVDSLLTKSSPKSSQSTTTTPASSEGEPCKRLAYRPPALNLPTTSMNLQSTSMNLPTTPIVALTPGSSCARPTNYWNNSPVYGYHNQQQALSPRTLALLLPPQTPLHFGQYLTLPQTPLGQMYNAPPFEVFDSQNSDMIERKQFDPPFVYF